MNEDILFNDGFDTYVGNVIAEIVDVVLAVSHWFALSLAVCLILSMIVRRRIRIIHTVLSFVLIVWYFMDGMDARLHAVIIAHPMTALAVLASMWLIVSIAIGAWTLTQIRSVPTFKASQDR